MSFPFFGFLNYDNIGMNNNRRRHPTNSFNYFLNFMGSNSYNNYNNMNNNNNIDFNNNCWSNNINNNNNENYCDNDFMNDDYITKYFSKEKEREDKESPKILKIYYRELSNDEKTIKEFFNKTPPLIGLKNVGCTCYMNAVLQCLCHIEKLVNYFKYDRFVIDLIQENSFKYPNQKNLLISSFKYLIESLWPTIYEFFEKNTLNNENQDNPSFSPTEFKEKISKMNSLFIGAQANDAKHLMDFIIMTLHKELNEFCVDNNKNNLPVDNTNKETALINFTKNYTKENNSKICDLFYGINGSSIQCLYCGIKIYNFQMCFFLNFPLEKVRKYKTNKNM